MHEPRRAGCVLWDVHHRADQRRRPDLPAMPRQVRLSHPAGTQHHPARLEGGLLEEGVAGRGLPEAAPSDGLDAALGCGAALLLTIAFWATVAIVIMAFVR